MKFEAERQDLHAALAKCLKATEKTTPHTAFKSCCIETDGKEQVRFFAGAEAVSVDTMIPADIQEPGKCIISPYSLSDIINAMPKGRVVMKADKKLSIKSKEHKRSYTLAFVECEIRRIEEPPGSPWPMSAPELLTAWETVMAGVALEGSAGPHGTIAAAELVVTSNGFSLSSSNGRAMIRVNVAGKYKPHGIVLIPRRAFQVLELLGAEDDKVKVSTDQRSIYWENNDTLASCRLIGEMRDDGSRAYPPIDGVIDALSKELDTSPKVTVAAEKLVDALKAVSPVIDNDKMTAVGIHLKGATLIFKAESETGSAEEELVVDEADRDFLVYVSPQLAKDALSPLKSKVVTLTHVDVHNALVITTENVFAVLSTINKR